MDRGDCQAIVNGVTKIWTQLKQLRFRGVGNLGTYYFGLVSKMGTVMWD